MSIIKRLWNDPVWSKVIAGIVLAVLGLVATYFLNWWPTIGHTLGRTIDYVGEASRLPNWLLGILWLSFAVVILLIALVLWAIIFPTPTVPAWYRYTSDVFFDVRWRWSYDTNGRPDKLTVYCPKCDYQVFLGGASIFGTSIQCDVCKRPLAELEESPTDLVSKVERFIQQKIRNGSWTTAVRT